MAFGNTSRCDSEDLTVSYGRAAVIRMIITELNMRRIDWWVEKDMFSDLEINYKQINRQGLQRCKAVHSKKEMLNFYFSFDK